MKLKSKIYFDYNDILTMCHNLEDKVSEMRPDLIVGVVRGGLLPAVHLSHALSVPMICLQWQTRDGEFKQDSKEIKDAIRSNKTIVFVDDINDSGRTFEELRGEYQEGKFVSLVERASSTFITDSTSLRIDDQRWIVFPWEKD
jgi:uncharacterized protein